MDQFVHLTAPIAAPMITNIEFMNSNRERWPSPKMNAHVRASSAYLCLKNSAKLMPLEALRRMFTFGFCALSRVTISSWFKYARTYVQEL
jgi:hypothetical protein